MQRLRLTFAKLGALRYTGHLDLHTAWERTFRRARGVHGERLPLAYSQGFNPHPRLQLASALPLGFTGAGELADVWLETAHDPAEVQQLLTGALPPGLTLSRVEDVPLDLPALQTLVRAADYQVTVADTACALTDLQARAAALLAATTLPRTRKDKAYDLRPLLDSLAVSAEPDLYRLDMRLAARDGATGRPEEVLAALELTPTAARYHRLRLLF
jgi:radical SAM-linked protein